jgi:hypothetical protein
LPHDPGGGIVAAHFQAFPDDRDALSHASGKSRAPYLDGVHRIIFNEFALEGKSEKFFPDFSYHSILGFNVSMAIFLTGFLGPL